MDRDTRSRRGSARGQAGPHPLVRAVVALLLGAGLGVVAALLQPRPHRTGSRGEVGA